MSEIEDLRKLVAFYQGEGPSHEAEQEYHFLVQIDKDKRTPEQVKRLVYLARGLSKAVDAQNEAFRKAMDQIE